MFDPEWLRLSFRRCLWDGGVQRAGDAFCCAACEQAYADWISDRVRMVQPEGVVEYAQEGIHYPVEVTASSRHRARTARPRRVKSIRFRPRRSSPPTVP